MPVFPAQQLNWLNAWKIKEKVAISDDLSNLVERCAIAKTSEPFGM